MVKRRKFLIGGTVFALALGFLIYQGIASTGTYYLTVSEYRAMGTAAAMQQVRVSGVVQDGTISWDPRSMIVRFVVADPQPGGTSVPVLYRGVVPDSFKPGVEVVLEGRPTAEGDVFEAKTLLTKCASKYKPLGG
ncbi:MAG: cytochrome c maturation protein CcmE [Chloroflexota bacterium]